MHRSFPNTVPQEVAVSQKSMLECRGVKVTWAHIVVHLKDTAGHSGHVGLRATGIWGRRRGGLGPPTPESSSLATPGSWASGLQRWETSPCGFKLPGLRSLVTAALRSV